LIGYPILDRLNPSLLFTCCAIMKYRYKIENKQLNNRIKKLRLKLLELNQFSLRDSIGIKGNINEKNNLLFATPPISVSINLFCYWQYFSQIVTQKYSKLWIKHQNPINYKPLCLLHNMLAS